MPELMNTREVARYLGVNEKKVYFLAKSGKIPCTRVTGKWTFPKKLIDQWIEESASGLVARKARAEERAFLLAAGSDDPSLGILHDLYEAQTQIRVLFHDHRRQQRRSRGDPQRRRGLCHGSPAWSRRGPVPMRRRLELLPRRRGGGRAFLSRAGAARAAGKSQRHQIDPRSRAPEATNHQSPSPARERGSISIRSLRAPG